MKDILKIIVIIIIAAIAVFVMPSACTRPDDTIRILKQQGYSNIDITGWRPLDKGEDDVFSTGFEAVSPSGQVVTGAVTSGWFKGGTIRFD